MNYKTYPPRRLKKKRAAARQNPHSVPPRGPSRVGHYAPPYQGRGAPAGRIYPPIRRRRKAKSYTPHIVALLFILGVIGYFAFRGTLPSILPGQGTPAGCPTTPKSQYVPVACQAARDAGIDPARFVRQINEESGFNPSEVSPVGAEGIAQFMPETAAGMGIDPWSPDEALKGAAQYMARLQANFDGDYAKALAAYNAGTGTVQSAIARCGPDWRQCLPAETQNYLNVIL